MGMCPYTQIHIRTHSDLTMQNKGHQKPGKEQVVWHAKTLLKQILKQGFQNSWSDLCAVLYSVWLPRTDLIYQWHSHDECSFAPVYVLWLQRKCNEFHREHLCPNPSWQRCVPPETTVSVLEFVWLSLPGECALRLLEAPGFRVTLEEELQRGGPCRGWSHCWLCDFGQSRSFSEHHFSYLDEKG